MGPLLSCLPIRQRAMQCRRDDAIKAGRAVFLQHLAAAEVKRGRCVRCMPADGRTDGAARALRDVDG